MKKVFNKINFAIIAVMTSMPAFAATGVTGEEPKGLCQLIAKMHDVFSILRTLAFVGAAFYIAGWAWKYISSGDAKPDDIKKQGTGLLVGFVMLFTIGILLSFALSSAFTGENGIWCQQQILDW